MNAQDMQQRSDEIKADVAAGSGKVWIAVCVDMRTHELVGLKSDHPWSPFEVWSWMLMEAARLDRKRTIQGRAIHLKRGQLVVSLRYLAREASWTIKAVRRFLDRLRRADMISLSVTSGTQMSLDFAARELSDVCPKRGTGITVVTICNYAKYQTAPARKGTGRAQEGHSRGTGRAQDNTQNTDTQNTKKSSGKRASRLPDDWGLPSDWKLWAERDQGLDPATVIIEAEKFKDYYIALPGSKGLKLDWLACWRNWCRSARDPKKIIQIAAHREEVERRNREAQAALAAPSVAQQGVRA